MHFSAVALVLLAASGSSAYKVDLTANQASYACPGDQKKTYTVTSPGKRSIIYELRCGVGTKATSLDNIPASSIKECADKCYEHPNCYSCDYVISDTATPCHRKSVPGPNIAYTGIDTFYPQECPRRRATAANTAPEETTDLTCPFSDGKIYKAEDGTWFYSQCCTDTSGSQVLSYEAAKDHNDCAKLCSDNKKCKAFLYADNGGIQPENCKLYTIGDFSTTFVEGGHFAYVTDPPTKDVVLSEAQICSTECPHADGQLYVAADGQNYQMFCKKRHGTDYLRVDRQDNFGACIQACSGYPGCDSVDYEPRTNKCFFSNNQVAPAINAEAFMSALSLGCAGACESCNDPAKCKLSSEKPLPLKEDVTCKDDDGSVITLETMEWRVNCYHCFHGHGAPVKPGKTLAECARHCAADQDCVGVNLIKDKCVLHRAIDSTGSKVFFAKNADCDVLAPLDRGHADMPLTDSGLANVKTTRDW